MSLSGIQYAFQEGLIYEPKIYYDFSSGNVGVSTVFDSTWRGRIKNVINNGIPAGIVYDMTGNLSTSRTNTLNNFINSGRGNFNNSNVLITGFSQEDFSSASSVIIFEIDGEVDDGVLLGSLKQRVDVFDGQFYTGYEGFNFGVTDRGHLFFQCGDRDGIKTFVAQDIEISKKDIISFSYEGNGLTLSRYDILSDKVYSQEFILFSSDIAPPSDGIMFLGGSDFYWNSNSGEQKTFNGSVDEFVFLNESIEDFQLKYLASGMLGDYFYNSGSPFQYVYPTGSRVIPAYGTGITGTYLNQIGVRNVPAGFIINDVVVEDFTFNSGEEGFRYFADMGDHIEEVGFLSSDFFGTYEPTGDGAYATLGLQTGTFTGKSYKIEQSKEVLFYQEPVYETLFLTGNTSDITGYQTEILYGTGTRIGAPSSGIKLTGEASLFKKDCIYFLD